MFPIRQTLSSELRRIKELVTMDNDYINKILDFYPFGADERYRGEYLLDNTQNAKNWIVGKYEYRKGKNNEKI